MYVSRGWGRLTFWHNKITVPACSLGLWVLIEGSRAASMLYEVYTKFFRPISNVSLQGGTALQLIHVHLE